MSSPPDLDARIAAFRREMRGETLWILVCPAAVLLSAFLYALYLRAPGSTLVYWPVPVVIIGGAFLMSFVLTRCVRRASIRANLMCPHCGVDLGGYIRYLKKDGRCPKCHASVVESV
jgi:hypothetical protein